MKILVVDDDPQILSIIQRSLLRVGHEVTLAADGMKAQAYFRENHYDLLITDMVMPEEDGLGLIRYIKQQGITIPIIAISGGSSELHQDVYLKCAEVWGDAQVLRKPFEIDELYRSIERISA